MGKIKTEGRVTLEFDPDLYEIHISVSAEGKTSGAAATAGKKQTESLLQALLDKLQIRPEQISAESENTEMPHSYGQNVPDDYRYTRSLLLRIPAENVLREAVTALLAEMDSAAYSVDAKLADESKQQQTARHIRWDAGFPALRRSAPTGCASPNAVMQLSPLALPRVQPKILPLI